MTDNQETFQLFKTYDYSTSRFPEAFGRGCFSGPANKSVSLIVENKSRDTVLAPTIAYFPFQGDFWADPVTIATSVAPGKRIEKSIESLNVRIFEFKAKFSRNGKIYRAEEPPSYPYFMKCIAIIVNDDLSYTTGIVWGYIP